jgi:hypothetical protein
MIVPRSPSLSGAFASPGFAAPPSYRYRITNDTSSAVFVQPSYVVPQSKLRDGLAALKPGGGDVASMGVFAGIWLYIPFSIKSEASSTPKGLYEKPDPVLKSERAAHKTREVNLRRGTEFHCVVAEEHQIMGLKGAFRHHLPDFLEINLRCKA